MGLFNKNSNGPVPYPMDDQPYANDTYPEPPPSLLRTRTDLSQASTFNSVNSFKKKGREALERKPEKPLYEIPKEDTEYMGMLLHQTQTIERRPYWNILAAALTWILLAGFIVLPGTYTNFQNSEIIQAAKDDQSTLGNRILAQIAAPGLLVVAAILCGIGTLGIIGLWYKWRKNYVWLINKLLLPALLNCFMGLLSTLVNVLSKPDKTFSLTAIVTTSVTGGLSMLFASAFLWYNYRLNLVKAAHVNAYKNEESQDPKDAIAAKYGEEAMV